MGMWKEDTWWEPVLLLLKSLRAPIVPLCHLKPPTPPPSPPGSGPSQGLCAGCSLSLDCLSSTPPTAPSFLFFQLQLQGLCCPK